MFHEFFSDFLEYFNVSKIASNAIDPRVHDKVPEKYSLTPRAKIKLLLTSVTVRIKLA